MARIEGLLPEEREGLIDLKALDVAREIIPHTSARYVHLRPYRYIPDVTSDPREPIVPITVDDFLYGNGVESSIVHLDDDSNLALDSRVVLEDGSIVHFPMMDLAPRKSEEALKVVKKRLAEVVVPHFGGGVILETGKSYQFLGTQLFPDERFEEFIGRSLLTSIVTRGGADRPRRHRMIADYRYAGHSLIRGSTGLRITANGSKTELPKVVDIV